MTAPTHRTVPVEPTEEMTRAAMWALDRARERDGKTQDPRAYTPQEKHAIRYRAMIEAAPPSDLPQSLRDRVVEEIGPLIEAAHGLSFGIDWNNGNHAVLHGYRQKLLDALPAAASLLLELKERGE